MYSRPRSNDRRTPKFGVDPPLTENRASPDPERHMIIPFQKQLAHTALFPALDLSGTEIRKVRVSAVWKSNTITVKYKKIERL